MGGLSYFQLYFCCAKNCDFFNMYNIGADLGYLLSICNDIIRLNIMILK